MLWLMAAASVSAQTGEGVNFVEGKTLYEVLQMGRQQGRLVFVDCYTTWCGPCKMMANREFPKKEAGDYFNAKFVNAKFDMEKGEGPEIATKYSVHAYPTFLVLDSLGTLVHRVVGAGPIDEFIKGVDAGLTGKTFGQYQKEYADGERGEAFLKEYMQLLQQQYMRDEATEVAHKLIDGLMPDAVLQDSVLFKAMPTYAPDWDDALFIGLCQKRDEVQQRYGAEGVQMLTGIFQKELQTCVRTDKEAGTVTLDDAKYARLQEQMRAVGFGDKVEELDRVTRQNMAYSALALAQRSGNVQSLLRALKGYEPSLASKFEDEGSIGFKLTEELTYAGALNALAGMPAIDKAARQYVRKMARARVKQFEKARKVCTTEYAFGGKKQTMADYAIERYQGVLEKLK